VGECKVLEITAAIEEVTQENARIKAKISDRVTYSSLNAEWVTNIEETKILLHETNDRHVGSTEKAVTNPLDLSTESEEEEKYMQ
jgi:hypothetical protein